MTLEEKLAVFGALQEEIESAVRQYEKATEETITGIKMVRNGERVAVIVFPSPRKLNVANPVTD